MLLLSGCYAAALAFFGDPDFGPIYSGYLGLLLFGMALVATGLLASALTANQVIAAVISLSIFLLLWIIDNFGWLLPSPADTLGGKFFALGTFPAVRGRFDLPFRRWLLPQRHAAELAADRASTRAAVGSNQMSRFTRSDVSVAALVVAAVVFGILGFAGFSDEVSNSLLFVSWSLTLLTLFIIAIRVPLRGSGSRVSAWATNCFIAVGAISVVTAANVALYRHDVHFDVTREGRNTPPQQLTDVIDQLHAPLSLTYFYNAGDPSALAARDLIAISARNHPLLAFRAIDLDKEPGLARDIGVHSYNTAILQADDRKVLVENVTDVTRLGYAVLRVLRKRPETICFVTGHGEVFHPIPAHFHYSHVETLKGHDTPGAGDVLVAEPEQLDRFQLALNEIGFDMRGIVPAATKTIPSDCAVVAEIGPRTAFTPGEADLLVEYLERGGRLLLLIDPLFPIDPDFESHLLGAVGLSTQSAIVIDPLNHFRTDEDKVAVPYYPPHPITKRLALTVFPQVRPIQISPGPDRREYQRACREQPG